MLHTKKSPPVRMLHPTKNPKKPKPNPSLCVWPCVLPVVGVGLLEHVPAGDLGFEFGADEEGAAHLAVQGVRLLGRRRQALPQHHRDESVDALGGVLAAEVEGLGGGEGLAEDHHGVHVGVLHRLNTGHGGVSQQQDGRLSSFRCFHRV